MSDLISRQVAIVQLSHNKNGNDDCDVIIQKDIETIKQLPSIANDGEWIYDKSIYNWRCSRCGQTPPPTGYVGTADFMATHFKFCNHCGADMRGEQNE